MQCEKLTNNINFSNGKGKFFSNTNKDYTDSSEERIDKLCEGLQYRINMLNKKINESIF